MICLGCWFAILLFSMRFYVWATAYYWWFSIFYISHRIYGSLINVFVNVLYTQFQYPMYLLMLMIHCLYNSNRITDNHASIIFKLLYNIKVLFNTDCYMLARTWSSLRWDWRCQLRVGCLSTASVVGRCHCLLQQIRSQTKGAQNVFHLLDKFPSKYYIQDQKITSDQILKCFSQINI